MPQQTVYVLIRDDPESSEITVYAGPETPECELAELRWDYVEEELPDEPLYAELYQAWHLDVALLQAWHAAFNAAWENGRDLSERTQCFSHVEQHQVIFQDAR